MAESLYDGLLGQFVKLKTRYGVAANYWDRAFNLIAMETLLGIDNQSDRSERGIELIDPQKYPSPRDAPALGQKSIALKTTAVKMPDGTG